MARTVTVLLEARFGWQGEDEKEEGNEKGGFKRVMVECDGDGDGDGGFNGLE